MCDAVTGLDHVKPSLLGAACSLCQRTHGAPAKCCATTCGALLHPLCARRHGLYVVAEPGGLARGQYRLYCGAHSEAMRAKDAELAEAKAFGVRAAAAPRRRPRGWLRVGRGRGNVCCAVPCCAASCGVPRRVAGRRWCRRRQQQVFALCTI